MAASANFFVRKLESFQPLSPEDREFLDLHARPVREIAAKQEIVREGDKVDYVVVVLSGFACRYKITDGGKRQILAYLAPGDFTSHHTFMLGAMDHSIGTLSRCHIIEIPAANMIALAERPAIALAFWWAALVDVATSRQWLVNLGQRQAERRIAHLLCELLVRLDAVGLVKDNTFTLPITQTDLGDTLGLTTVHVNRMFMKIKEQNLIAMSERELTVLDVAQLATISGFNPNYLHLQSVRQSIVTA